MALGTRSIEQPRAAADRLPQGRACRDERVAVALVIAVFVRQHRPLMRSEKRVERLPCVVHAARRSDGCGPGRSQSCREPFAVVNSSEAAPACAFETRPELPDRSPQRPFGVPWPAH